MSFASFLKIFHWYAAERKYGIEAGIGYIRKCILFFVTSRALRG